MEDCKKIVKDQTVYAIIVKSEYTPKQTKFLTDDKDLQQLGFIVYESGGNITPHAHKKHTRTINRTTETLIVKKGIVEYEIYDKDQNSIANGLIKEGDIIALLDGGHGFKIIEDAILIEIKQGPFLSTEKDKKRF